MNDVEKARSVAMNALETKRTRERSYEDGRMIGESKIGADKKMVEESDHEGEIEEVGSFDPYTGKYVPSYRKEVAEAPFVPGTGFEQPGAEGLKIGEKLPAEFQPKTWNPRLNGNRGGYEPAGYETPVEEGTE